MSLTPPYRRIADDLRGRILAGYLTPGTQLPSENELAAEYSTTRTTARKAIAVLRGEGLITSSQGRGAFVRPRPHVRMLLTGTNYRANRATGMSNFNAEAASQGQQARQQLLHVGEVPAPPEVAERLQIEPGQPVLARKRLFLVDEEPAQFVDGYYPLDLFAGTPVAEHRLIPGGVHAVIEDPAGPIATRVVQFVEDLTVRMPTPHESEGLAIPTGVPVARVLRTAYASHTCVVEVLDSLVPCDRHTFRYVIDVP